MNFEELGVMLRQERERRGLSVEEVANHLKLMPRVVRAIEQGDTRELPQAAYARGFVKSYGNLLALDTALLYAGMDDAWPDDAHQPSAPYEPAEEKSRGGKGRLIALVTLMLLLAGAGWIWLARDPNFSLPLPAGLRLQAEPAAPAKNVAPSPPARTRDVPPTISETQPTIRQTGPTTTGGNQTAARQTNPTTTGGNQTAARQTSPTPAESPAPAENPTPAESPTSPGSPTSAGSVTPAAPSPPAATQQRDVPPTTGGNRTAARQTSPPSAGNPVSASAAATQENQHNLVIMALAECWVHSTADNTETRQFALRKGDTFALTFSKKLTLRLGNAGGVKIRLDGRDLGPPGEAGQVKTLTFPANP